MERPFVSPPRHGLVAAVTAGTSLSTTPPRRHAVIIGAGLGGLALSLRLAKRGWRVTICEHSATPGGKMNRWTKDGFTFDTGPSLITMPWIFRELFESIGSRMDDHLELVSMRPIMRAVYPDGTSFIYSNSMPEWLETVRNLDKRDVDGFLRFLRLGARIFEVSNETFLRRPPTAPPDVRVLRALRHFPFRHAWGNYSRAVEAHFHSPHLRQLYNRYPTYVGSSPYRAPATLFVIPFIEFAFGGWYVNGGLYRIVEALTALAGERSIDIRLNTSVECIATSNGRAAGMLTNSGERIDADVVIMNGDASCAGKLLGLTPVSPENGDSRSMSGVVFLLGTRKRLPGIHHHSVYFSSDYKNEFADIFDRRRFPDEPTVYVSAPSRTDRAIAPDSGEALFVMANAPSNGKTKWDFEQPEIRRRIFDVLRRGGLHIDETDIAVEQMWSPQTIAQRYQMPGGAIYGAHSHGWRSAFLRPPNKDRRVGGLYYVGGSTHPGGGTPTVLISARITSELIQHHEGA